VTAIDSLKLVLPPPANPAYTGTQGEWAAVESGLGVTLPRDYKQFISEYGAGSIDEYLVVYSPFWSESSLAHELARLQHAYHYLVASLGYFPVPYPIFPEVGGLLPWGSTANGDVCSWITDQGDPDRWPILIDDGEGSWERLDMSMTAMIYAGIREELDSSLMLFPSPEPEFLPPSLTR
jgi:hypothetical protein